MFPPLTFLVVLLPPCALWAGAVLLYGEPAPLPKSGGRQHDQKGRGGRQHHQKKEEGQQKRGAKQPHAKEGKAGSTTTWKVNFPLVLLLFGSCAASLLLLWVTLPSSASWGGVTVPFISIEMKLNLLQLNLIVFSKKELS